ncbi:MAG: hypothetical protein KatS3mg109_0794 [Pirellulaceae bacterium]|nr:MAG: hypothetical protein KatS3mg109_0794 [Pirellulaceae bacterium]
MLFWKTRNKRFDLDSFLRGVADITNPEADAEALRARKAPRFPRSFPVLLVPIEGQQPVWDQSLFGLSQDLSMHGMGLIVSRRLTHNQVVLGIWPTNELLTAASSQPGFIFAQVRSQTEIGAGFFRLGLRFTGMLSDDDPGYSRLLELAKALLPPEQLLAYKRARNQTAGIAG